MELYIWGSGLSLPTVDPECLLAVVILAQLRQDFTIVRTTSALGAPHCHLPALRQDNIWISGASAIVDYLKKRGFDIDGHLTAKQKAISTAHISLLNSLGYDLTLYSLFLNRENFEAVTRPAYSHALSFPMQYWTPIRMRSFAKNRIAYMDLSAYDQDGDDQAQSNGTKPSGFDRIRSSSQRRPSKRKLTQRIKLERFIDQLYQPINAIIVSSDNLFAFGSKPSLLDLVIFSQLAYHLFPDMPADHLKKSLQSPKYQRIAAFIHTCRPRFLKMHELKFSDKSFSLTSTIHSLLSNTATSFTQPFRNLRSNRDIIKNTIFAGSLITGLLVYLLANGIIRIEFGNKSIEDDASNDDYYTENGNSIEFMEYDDTADLENEIDENDFHQEDIYE